MLKTKAKELHEYYKAEVVETYRMCYCLFTGVPWDGEFSDEYSADFEGAEELAHNLIEYVETAEGRDQYGLLREKKSLMAHYYMACEERDRLREAIGKIHVANDGQV